MNPSSSPLTQPLHWQPGPSAELVYHCSVQGAAPAASPAGAQAPAQEWLIRLNDFPQQPLYTLLIDGVATLDFDQWPACWQR